MALFVYVTLISLYTLSGLSEGDIELTSATINGGHGSDSVELLAHLMTDEIKQNGFVFLNDSHIGETIEVDSSTNRISGLQRLSDLVLNISIFYHINDSKETTFSYTLGNVAGRREIARGINKISGAPKQVLVTAHSEASYLSHAPLYLIFACPGVPDINNGGGQTIIYSIDRIMDTLMANSLGRNLLDEVAKYGVIYIRNDPHILNLKYKTIWDGVNYPVWQNRFSGKSKQQITTMLAHSNQNVSWIPFETSDGVIYETLHTEWHMPGFRLHPRTNKIVWFNQLYSMNGRYFRAHKVKGMDELLLNERPLHTLIGNGRQLTDAEYELLDDIHDELAILIPWDHTGDVLAIDNFVYQHGRTAYNSYRSCVINWGMAVRGGEYVYDPNHFTSHDPVDEDIHAIYTLLDEFNWYDTVYQNVFYRDNSNDQIVHVNAINSTEISAGIYKEIFEYRRDINVAIHVLNPDISAIAMSQYSFLPIDQSYYMLYPHTKYMQHDELHNISNILGMESKLLLIENNGMIVFGNRFDETFTRLFYAIRAAQSQILALSIHNQNINNIIFPSAQIQQITIDQSLNFNVDGYGYLEFMAWKRRYKLTRNVAIAQKDEQQWDLREYNLRKDISKAYHILDRLGWTETIYQHITGVLASNNDIMLINAYGLEFGEVNINNLMKVAMNGTVIAAGNSIRAGKINPSGLALHSAIHTARSDAKIVIHCHHPAISAISVYKYGLLSHIMDQNYRNIIGKIVYHDFDSLSLAINKTVLASELSDGSNVIILRNHGIITVAENVKDAFNRLYYTVMAAQTQIKYMISNANLAQNIDIQTENNDENCQLNNNNFYNAWDRF